MLRRKHVIVINFYNNLSKIFFRLNRDKINVNPKSDPPLRRIIIT